MSFWSKAGEIAKNVGTVVVAGIEKSANETRELKAKYENMEEEKLVEIVRKTEGWGAKPKKDRAIAFSILKQRGYDIESLRNK